MLFAYIGSKQKKSAQDIAGALKQKLGENYLFRSWELSVFKT
jgi:hypothetical protein|tara:strand:+ start:13236 stop:13361 length:126 start_codon:yes stop_codon:yes gene_type:complete